MKRSAKVSMISAVIAVFLIMLLIPAGPVRADSRTMEIRGSGYIGASGSTEVPAETDGTEETEDQSPTESFRESDKPEESKEDKGISETGTSPTTGDVWNGGLYVAGTLFSSLLVLKIVMIQGRQMRHKKR